MRDRNPPNVYATFLDFLIARRRRRQRPKVWTQLAQLHRPLPTALIFLYIR